MWVVVLIILTISLIVFLWRGRERFATGSVQPNCPEGLILVGKKCRGDGTDMIDGQCPEGMMMNEEGMCQRLEDPVCPAEYTLAYDDVSAMCELKIPIQEPSEEEMYARSQAATQPQCPAGFTRSFLMEGELGNLPCMRDTGQTPVCPVGSTFDPDVHAWSASEPLGTGVCFSATGPVPAKCPPNTFPDFIYLENAQAKFTCMELAPVRDEPPPPVTPTPPVAPTPPPVEPPIAPPPAVKPEMIIPPPTPKELVFQSRLLGTPGSDVVPADTRIGELIGGLFSPSQPRKEPRPSEYTL